MKTFGPFLKWIITADLILLGILDNDWVHLQCGSEAGLKSLYPNCKEVLRTPFWLHCYVFAHVVTFLLMLLRFCSRCYVFAHTTAGAAHVQDNREQP
jgi:hypothetical protein